MKPGRSVAPTSCWPKSKFYIDMNITRHSCLVQTPEGTSTRPMPPLLDPLLLYRSSTPKIREASKNLNALTTTTSKTQCRHRHVTSSQFHGLWLRFRSPKTPATSPGCRNTHTQTSTIIYASSHPHQDAHTYIKHWQPKISNRDNVVRDWNSSPKQDTVAQNTSQDFKGDWTCQYSGPLADDVQGTLAGGSTPLYSTSASAHTKPTRE